MTAAQLANLISLRPQGVSDSSYIDRVLKALRTHLGLDVAFVAQFRADDRVFTHVDADGQAPINPGDTLSHDAGYCQRVVDGLLPELIADTSLCPLAMELPETTALPIGAHLSVPILLSDGRLYGTLCCFGYEADPTLGERDIQMMRVFADLVGGQLDSELNRVRDRVQKHRRISAILASDQPSIVFQPILAVQTLELCGWECLARFNTQPPRTPDLWFREAAEAGLGVDLELRAIEHAISALAALPEHTYLALNCSPQLVYSGRLNPILEHLPARRLVLEITEHAAVADYKRLEQALAPLRQRGVRLSIDDTGAGYASMRHILELSPDVIKLDMSITQGIDHDFKRRALASSLIAFARETGSSVVAEGVETEQELETLQALGVHKVQGYLLGRPQPLADALVAARKKLR
ncbi:MAG: EAL domain-containing protein [Pseudomonas sp.]|uniref:sensor domain-containing phosphodiesterase n=1 Tax=Pseudomonas sp. TaxID=306 RepID=UPI0030F0386A